MDKEDLLLIIFDLIMIPIVDFTVAYINQLLS